MSLDKQIPAHGRRATGSIQVSWRAYWRAEKRTLVLASYTVIDVNELPDDNNGPEDTLEDEPVADEQKSNDLEEAQKDGAEEREEGGLY